MLKKVMFIICMFFISHIYGNYPIAGSPAQQGLVGTSGMQMGNSTPSFVLSNTGAKANTTAKTLSNPLYTVFVSISHPGGLYGGTLDFKFDSSVISQIPSSVIQNGLYGSMNIATGTYTWGGNTNKKAHKFEAILTDQAGNVYAQTTFYAPYSGTQYYYDATTAEVIFEDNQGNQTSVSSIALSSGKRAFFKGTGGSATAQPISGGSGGGTGNYPIAGSPAQQGLVGTSGMQMGNSTPSFVLSNTGAKANTTAKTLSNPLYTVFVSISHPGGLYGGTLDFKFDSSVISQIPSSVIQNGLYGSMNIATGTYTWGGNTNKKAHKFEAILTDQAGNVYAQTTFYAPYSGTQYYYDATTAEVIFKDGQGNQTSVSSIALSSGKRAWFKGAGGSATAQPIGGGGSGITGSGGVLLGSTESLDYLALELDYGTKAVTVPLIQSGLTIYKSAISGALSAGFTLEATLTTSGSDRQISISGTSAGSVVSGFPTTATTLQTSGNTKITTSDSLTDAYVVYQTNNMDEAVKDKLSISSNAVTQSYKFASSANISFTKISNAGPGPKNLNPGGGTKVDKSMSRFG